MPLLWALWELALLGAASSRDVDASSDSERYAPSVDISLYKAFEFATLSTGGPKQPSMKILSAAGLEDLNQLAGTRLKEMEQYAQDALTNKVLLAREEMNLSRQRFQAVADQVAKEVEARTARLEQQWLQLAVASGHGQVGKCCCPQDEDCVWHNFAAGGDRDCPVGMQDYRDRVKPGATGLTSSGAVDMLLAQCVNSTGWTERPWALPGAPAGAAEAAGPAQEPAGAEAAEGPWRGAGPAGPAELGDGTVLPPSGGAEAAAPLEPLGEEDPAQDAIQVEARVPLPSDEDLIDKDSELLEPVIPGGSPAILDSPLLVPKAPAVEEEEAPLVTPVRPQEEEEEEEEEEDPRVKPDKLVKPDAEEKEDPPVMPDRFVQPGAPVVEEDPPVRPDKLVKPEDTGEDAMGRPLPVEFPDDSSGKPDLDEDATPEKLQVPAGERPAQGGVPCEDAPGFLDERHEPCGAWASYQIGCHRATEDIGFSQDGENALVRNCRKSCGLCGSEPEDALASEADNTTPQLTTPETAAPETISPQATTPETTTPCDCDNVETETVHVKITAVLTPTAPARGGSLAQREARGGGRRDGSGCDCAGGRSGSAPPAHVELAGPENLPASAVAGALAAAVAAPDAESTTDV